MDRRSRAADSGIPREWVDAARENIKDNPRPQSSGLKFYELAGMAYCGCCGRQTARTTTKNNAGTRFFYYRCMKRWNEGKEACANNRSYSAKKLEAAVWERIRAHMTEPERLRNDLERMIELVREEMRTEPEREAKAWLDKLAEVDRKEDYLLEVAADTSMPKDKLRAKLAELEEARKRARRELAAARESAGELERLEREAEALLEHYEAVSPEALDSLAPEERHYVYRTLRLRVLLHPDKSAELEFHGAPVGEPLVSNSETESECHS